MATGTSDKLERDVAQGAKSFEETNHRLRDQTSVRKEAEPALTGSETLWRTVFDGSPVGLGLLDPEGRFMKTNAALRQLCGSDSDHLNGAHCGILLEDDSATPAEFITKLRYGELRSIPIEKRLVFPPREPVWVRGSLTAIRDQEARLLHLLLVVEDITDRKQVELELERSRASLARAQAIAHVGNWDWDIKNDTLHWSDEIYNIFGLVRGEFAATYPAFLAAVHPEDRACLEEAVARAVKGLEPYSIEHRIVRPDGTERIVHEQGKVTFDDQGQPVHMIGTVQDVTAARRTHEQLQTANRRVRDILNSIRGHFFAVDGQWQITFTNRGMEEDLAADGTPPELVIGQKLWDVCRPNIDAEGFECLKRAHSGRAAVQFDSFYPPAGTWSRVQTYPTEEGMATHIQDVTFEKTAELERQKFAALVENSSDFIGIATLEGRMTYVNQGGLRLVGRDHAGSLAGTRIEDFFLEEDHAQLGLIVATILQEGEYRGEFRFRHQKTNAAIPVELNGFLLRDSASGKPVAMATVSRDISEWKALQSKLLSAASHDPLTTLLNRRAFMAQLERVAQRARGNSQRPFAVAFVDVNGLKQVNDTWGHAVGDQVLQGVGRRLADSIRPQDICGRMGGDEFAVVATDLEQRLDAHRLVERFSRALEQPMELGAVKLSVTASVGLVHSMDGPHLDTEHLLAQADKAMYDAKARSKLTAAGPCRDPPAPELDTTNILRACSKPETPLEEPPLPVNGQSLN